MCSPIPDCRRGNDGRTTHSHRPPYVTRPTTRLLAILLTGFFLVQGIGVSPSPLVAGEGGVTVDGRVAAASGHAESSNTELRTAIETPGELDAGEAPAGCADGELPCVPQDGPPPCTVASTCAAPVSLPAGFGVVFDASPNDRGLIHPVLREPGSVFLEHHTPPPRA